MARGNAYSYQQPVWHFVLLSVTSFGIYQTIWFYRTWKQLKEHRADDRIRPGARTLALSVPVLNLILTYGLLRDIGELGRSLGLSGISSPGLLTAVFWVVLLTGVLPNPWWLLSLASVVPLAQAQGLLNACWAKAQSGLPTRSRLNRGETLTILLGGSLLLAITAAMSYLIATGRMGLWQFGFEWPP